MLRQGGGSSSCGFTHNPWGTTNAWMRSRRISKRVLASPGGIAMVMWLSWPHFDDRSYLLRERLVIGPVTAI
ncbi:hypothetical protein AVEN_199179-1, partial [Araneus ventricosus]